MAITNTPTNPHNNGAPIIMDVSKYTDPFEMALILKGQTGIPEEVANRVHSDCLDRMKNSWMGFIDGYQMTMMSTTDYVHFTQSEQPDYVIDDDGAVTRAGNVFTIDWSLVQGWEAGQDSFFYRKDFTIAVYDDTGLEEIGVIESVDAANNQFTAKCRNGLNWSVATTNLTIDVNGGDFDKESCGPEGLLELRKTTSLTCKLQNIKDAMKASPGKEFQIFLDNGDYKWYSENTMKLQKRLDVMIAKTLLREVESADGSGAYLIGKFGSKGLFQNLRENALVHSGYITNVAGVQSLTAYWDSLGYSGKEFFAHVDTVQYRYFEAIAAAYPISLGITLNVGLNNAENNYMKFGFNSLTIDGYTIHFSKWELTTGNSDLGKNRVAAAMPKGIIMPSGTVPTMINGVEKQMPYIFKIWQNLPMIQAGMVRTFFTGAGAHADGRGSDCEYLKITKSTNVGVAVPCPESITLID